MATQPRVTIPRKRLDEMTAALNRLRLIEEGNRVDHSDHINCTGQRSWKTVVARDVAAILDEIDVQRNDL